MTHPFSQLVRRRDGEGGEQAHRYGRLQRDLQGRARRDGQRREQHESDIEHALDDGRQEEHDRRPRGDRSHRDKAERDERADDGEAGALPS
jgi:hypothetical protein